MTYKEHRAQPSSGIADKTPISSIMTTDVFAAHEQMDLCELSRKFLEIGISGAPVVDDRGVPVGVVSKTDLVRHAYEQGAFPAAPPQEGRSQPQTACSDVRDIMTPVAYALTPDISIAHAAALMAFEGIHRVPIVSQPRGTLVGLLASSDILRWLGEQSGYLKQSPAVAVA
jgi:CBS domain-containing protein